MAVRGILWLSGVNGFSSFRSVSLEWWVRTPQGVTEAKWVGQLILDSY